MAKSKKQVELEQQVGELTQDLQRTRADFENYQKRIAQEKSAARRDGASQVVREILPTIDIIEQATRYVPDDLKDNPWVKGVVGLNKNLDKALQKIGVAKIDASEGVDFNPEIHEAVQVDEDASGDREVVSEELRAGYTYNEHILRHAMVKVTRK